MCVCVCVATICFYDDDVLRLVEMVPGAVLLQEADHLSDPMQGGVQVGARLTPVACR